MPRIIYDDEDDEEDVYGELKLIPPNPNRDGPVFIDELYHDEDDRLFLLLMFIIEFDEDVDDLNRFFHLSTSSSPSMSSADDIVN